MVTLRRVRLEPPSLLPLEQGGLRAVRQRALTSHRKRALDIVVSLVLLVLTSPVWLAAAILIKIASPGPILFRQERIGVNGEPFVCLKFRTMHHGVSDSPHRALIEQLLSDEVSRADAGTETKRVYKLNGDPRIIGGVGRWLRRTSLDELPQLVNVLRGEMSIVGPRPPLRYEVERYEDWQHDRLAVRPGITGLWQVSGRNRLTYNEMCKLDVQYIQRWSIAVDLLIMLSTPWVMFGDRGGAS
jgi:lipopolysaccharide/colanic/teichoic acid biosynthesis glycosyltransferase